MDMQIKKTNKAKLKIKADKVEKIYYDKERAETEYNNYNKLYSIMKEAKQENWNFKSPQIYRLNNNRLTMEKARGLSLDSLINEGKYEASYYTGVYLGVFQKLTRHAESGKCISYGDYNRTNLFVDFQNKTVWGIDPGDRFGKFKKPEYDLMIMYFSIIIEEIRTRNFYFSSSRKFIKGYRETVSWKINSFEALKELNKIIKKISIKRYSKIKSCLITIFLGAILSIILFFILFVEKRDVF